MTAPGAKQISYRGIGPWGGMSTQSRATPYLQELLENCYVSSDGQEIRPIPGFKTYVDLSAPRLYTTGPSAPIGGFERDVVDARRPVSATTGSYQYQDATTTQTLTVWSSMTHVHAFDFLGGRMVLIGESGLRREPIHASASSTRYVYVTAYTHDTSTGSAMTLLTLNEAFDFSLYGVKPFNTAREDGGAAHDCWRIYLSGLTGPGAAVLNGFSHEVYAVGGAFAAPVIGGLAYPSTTTILIRTSVGSGNNGTSQTGFIDRVSKDHVSSTTTVSDDEESLTIWTIPNPFGSSLPIQTCQPAYVANRQRDFGDLSTFGAEEGGQLNCSRRRQEPLPYRVVPHVAGNRLIIVAPGYNCVFQAPAVVPITYEGTATDGLAWIANDLYDKPRCVGVPKAVMWVDVQKTYAAGSAHVWDASAEVDAYSFGGTGLTERAGTYKFAVCYKDDVTGETGLISETVAITTDATTIARQGIILHVMFPGYLMSECLAMTVTVFRSQRNGESLYFDQNYPLTACGAGTLTPGGAASAKYGIQPEIGLDAVMHGVALKMKFTADSDLEKHESTLPIIEQMPIGAKAARTVRGGWTVYGGALGNAGTNRELWKGTVGTYYDVNSPIKGGGQDPLYPRNDEVFTRVGRKTGTGVPNTLGFTQWGVGGYVLPTSYAGQEIVSKTLFPTPRQTVRLNKIVNTEAWYTAGSADEDRFREVRYQVVESPFGNADFARDPAHGDVYIKLPRSVLQISEADNPGVVPATNSTIVSKDFSEDIEAIGESNGQLVACSRGKTYFIGFGQSPVGVPAELASDNFGCIGANTMVSYDHGCAWISDRGPCALVGGRFVWIGESIQHLFVGSEARYLRDSRGMMRHAWGAHDPERGLLYFGLYANRNTAHTLTYAGSTATWSAWHASNNDQPLSRFPCDEILVYSYRVGQWSVWRPPTSLYVKWMAKAIDEDGKPRMFFLGSDNRVYVMDDKFSQWNENAIEATVDTAATSTTISTDGTFATSIASRGLGTFIEAGMQVLVVSQAAGRPLIKATTLVSESAGDLTLADAVTVAVGDKVYVGTRSYTVKTNFINMKGMETSRAVRAGMRFSMESLTGSEAVAFAKCSVTTSRLEDDEIVPKTVCFTQGETGYDDYRFLSEDDNAGYVLDRSFLRGAVQGVNTRLELTVVGSAAVRLQDAYLEAQ